MATSNVLSFLGLATKAGKVVSGDRASRIYINKGKAHLIIIADDAVDRTLKEFTYLSEQYNISIRSYGNKEALGQIIGKKNRAVIIVKDKSFANRLIEMIDCEIGGKMNG